MIEINFLKIKKIDFNLFINFIRAEKQFGKQLQKKEMEY